MYDERCRLALFAANGKILDLGLQKKTIRALYVHLWSVCKNFCSLILKLCPLQNLSFTQFVFSLTPSMFVSFFFNIACASLVYVGGFRVFWVFFTFRVTIFQGKQFLLLTFFFNLVIFFSKGLFIFFIFLFSC